MEQLQNDFFNFRKKVISEIKSEYDQIKMEKQSKRKKDFEAKYTFLRRKVPLPTLREIFSWSQTKERFNYETYGKPLLEIFIAKITGLFKHGQTEKTQLCNFRIVSNAKNNMLSIAISKNTLNAKEQWEERLIKDLRKEFPHTPLNQVILIISSKKNTLNGNATHCKNVKEAKAAILDGNYKIIFVCSNNSRIENINEILECYPNLAPEKRLFVDVQHDEAHNAEEGIPSKRVWIEHLIMNPYVKSYVPVSASPDPIFSDEEPLWKRENIEKNAINYSDFSTTLSTSENYSSISDARKITFAQYKNHPSFKDYNIKEFDEETFMEAEPASYYADKQKWSNPNDIKADRDRRRQLEFNTFMALEKHACNIGMNILDNYYRDSYNDGDTYVETPLILSDIFNIHIMTTPLRVALTIHLMKHAMHQSYNPICIGLYRSEIHIRYRTRLNEIKNKKYCDFDIDSNSRELNSKIHDILEYLKSQGESIDRPVLIFGNYKPTGESITFVNYKYGTIRSDTLLPVLGQTREKSYQGFLRCCYMDTKFREHNPSFIHPPKWIMGEEDAINDAIAYELENDERVLSFIDGSHSNLLVQATVIPANYPEEKDKGIAIPVKLEVQDPDDCDYAELVEIFKKKIRSEDEKIAILLYLKNMKENRSVQITDPTGKFNFDDYSLKFVRTYKKDLNAENYRFPAYDSSHYNKLPYINDKNAMSVNDCEILVAVDKYQHDGFINHKLVMWIGYRYA